jgi:hypothetical protein
MFIKKPKVSLILAVLATIAVVVAGFVFHAGKKGEKEEKTVSGVSATAREPKVDMDKLVGRWLRLDGGYIIEIRSAGANGKLDAGYFNPNPINVSLAEASRRGDAVRVFIELQDVGYPGSSYTLTYDPQRDLLSGTYFQAALNQTFDVMFVRTK